MTYSTINNLGDVGVTGVSYNRAIQDVEYNNDHYPDEEWEVIEDDNCNEHNNREV